MKGRIIISISPAIPAIIKSPPPVDHCLIFLTAPWEHTQISQPFNLKTHAGLELSPWKGNPK